MTTTTTNFTDYKPKDEPRGWAEGKQTIQLHRSALDTSQVEVEEGGTIKSAVRRIPQILPTTTTTLEKPLRTADSGWPRCVQIGDPATRRT